MVYLQYILSCPVENLFSKPQIMMTLIGPSSKFDLHIADIWQGGDSEHNREQGGGESRYEHG